MPGTLHNVTVEFVAALSNAAVNNFGTTDFCYREVNVCLTCLAVERKVPELWLDCILFIPELMYGLEKGLLIVGALMTKERTDK